MYLLAQHFSLSIYSHSCVNGDILYDRPIIVGLKGFAKVNMMNVVQVQGEHLSYRQADTLYKYSDTNICLKISLL